MNDVNIALFSILSLCFEVLSRDDNTKIFLRFNQERFSGLVLNGTSFFFA